ncbi:hypothetical protein AL755_08595 [Arthrobacter sp. ERGS1:01]|nr:hypothetical protein AL755_08595 [Arthrobacter sp. ERGS1:01]
MSLMPPKGYSKVKGRQDLWTGVESMDRGWIVTPTWNSATGNHALEVWTPRLNFLTPAEARRLAQVLLAAADAAEAASTAMKAQTTGGSQDDG